uniref:Uncharacterized protein n=1 Tax=uncultured marine virus TaxID=186617 RepID=A0A0F7L9J8_9VIRU|nr:hypothetical protein [uncultured marine virus]
MLGIGSRSCRRMSARQRVDTAESCAPCLRERRVASTRRAEPCDPSRVAS